MKVGLSIGLSPREDLRRFVRLCQSAEEGGIDTVWVIDSQLAMKDPYVAMSVALWETERLKLGTGVTNPQTRHLSVTANSAATLSEMSEGRYLLGLGAGDSAVFPLGHKPSTIRELRTAIGSLRALLRGESVSRSDENPIHLSFVPATPPPVYLSASQVRMLTLAGAAADGVILMGPANEDIVAGQIESVSRGAAEAGRTRADVMIDLWVTVAVDDEDWSGVDAVRSWASAKARWMSGWKDLPQSLERFRPELDRSAETYDFSSHLSLHAEHAHSVSDELAKALAVAGTVDECVERLRKLSSLGPDRITLTLLSGGRERRLDGIIREVIPALNG